MKKNILKICFVISLLFIILGTLTISANAALDPEADAKNTVMNYLTTLSKGNSFGLRYIDPSNTELYQTANDKLHNYDYISYSIDKVKTKGDIYKVEVKISVRTADNVSVDGVTAEFDVKNINGIYKITDTDFFKITSPEYVAGMALGIIAIIFAAIGIVFVGIIVVIIVVIIIVVKKNKKK